MMKHKQRSSNHKPSNYTPLVTVDHTWVPDGMSTTHNMDYTFFEGMGKGGSQQNKGLLHYPLIVDLCVRNNCSNAYVYRNRIALEVKTL